MKMQPTPQQIETGAQALMDRARAPMMETGRDWSEIVLSAVLPPMAAQIEALKPDKHGRISKGLVLAYLLGELS